MKIWRATGLILAAGALSACGATNPHELEEGGAEGLEELAESADSATSNPLPYGWLDGVSGRTASGWACDPSDFSKALAIHFYDGNTFLAHTTANLVREPAVAASCGGHAAHGFRYDLPASILDGQRHEIRAYAINIPLNGQNPMLSGSPKIVQQQPTGSSRPRVTCDAMRSLAGTTQDAAGTLQGCINQTPAGGVLRIPAGRYMMHQAVRVTKALKIATENKLEADPPCALSGPSGCAELVASPQFLRVGGFFDMAADGIFVDHLIFDGNRVARANSEGARLCAGGSNGYGYNIRVMCSNCVVKKSVSKNALCGTAMEVSGRGRGVVIEGNIIANNGVHNAWGLWADGITVHDYSDSRFVDNLLINSTDIDLIFGGCARCVVQRNTIRHDSSSPGAFAALMIQRWPGAGGTSGDYSGADFSSNHIDCGPNKACGFGILIGSDPWYSAPIFGGAVHDNTILNPQQGLAIQDASSMAIYRNQVSGRAASTRVSCDPSRPRATSDRSRSGAASNINYAGESPSLYQSIDWRGCIPNWAL